MARVTDRGFYMAASMTPESHRFYTQRWQSQISKEPFWSEPLDESSWIAALSEGGSYDRTADTFRTWGVVPVFYALPTNPIMVDTVRREDVRQRNSDRMRNWAQAKGVGFIDQGVPRELDPVRDFEDHRHTSADGAARTTKQLAEALVKSGIAVAACTHADAPITVEAGASFQQTTRN